MAGPRSLDAVRSSASLIGAVATLWCLATPAVAQDTASASDGLEAARSIIADVQRIVTPNGIDETAVLKVGGTRQVVNIRGSDRANPILLYVHGGPGSVEMPMAWTFQRPWEDLFTVVQWDQRGAGRSYPLNDAAVIAPTLRLETYRDDAIDLIEQLGRRLGQRKVFLLGHSFGSAVGLAVAAKRPDLLHAYVGMGQLIDFRENERTGMRRTVAMAQARGDDAAVRAINALRPYPDGPTFTIEQADAWRRYANRYGSLAAGRPDANFYFDSTRLSPLYGPADRAAWAKGSTFTVTTLWPRLADVTFTRLSILRTPVVFFLGRHDNTTPSEIAAAWLTRLKAPSRRLCWFEHSGHLPMIEEPGKVLAALLAIRPLAAGLPTSRAESCRSLH
jgi:proline iminopeptidase